MSNLVLNCHLKSKIWSNFKLNLIYFILGKRSYGNFDIISKRNEKSIYFCLLQCHPVDVVMTFRPSPNTFTGSGRVADLIVYSGRPDWVRVEYGHIVCVINISWFDKTRTQSSRPLLIDSVKFWKSCLGLSYFLIGLFNVWCDVVLSQKCDNTVLKCISNI